MRLSRWMTLVCGLLTAVPASAQHFGGRCQQAPSCCPCTPSTTTVPGEQPKTDQAPMVDPSFAPEQATAGGTEGYAMNMIGDFIAVGQGVSLATLPLTAHSLKVADNQNVRPQDRVYLNYNFYDNLVPPPETSTFGFAANHDAFVTVFGVEKTFLDGNVSLGARLPINSLDGDEFNGTAFGDLAFIFKVLLIGNDTCAACAGVGFSCPTGPDVFAGVVDRGDRRILGDFHSYTVQPYVAGLHVSGNFFAQAWTALAIPVEDEVPTIWFVDVGTGYICYRKACNNCNGCGCGLSALAGILELHANIPLEHDSLTDFPIGISDWVVLVEGVSAQFGRSVLTVGLGQPLTGPKPYQMEGIIQFNFFF